MKIEVNGHRVFIPATQRGYDCYSESQARMLASVIREATDAAYIEGRNDSPRWKCGWLVNKGSAWLGVHYSKANRRWCINLLPCITFWITKPGGNTP